MELSSATSLIKQSITKSRTVLSPNCGLFEHNGLGNIMILLEDQELHNHSDHSRIIQKQLDYISKQLENGFIPLTFGNGLYGFAWYLNHIKNKSEIQGCYEFFLNQIDEIALVDGKKKLSENNHDFIYGAIGNMVYLTERISEPKVTDYFHELIIHLNSLAFENEFGIYWKDADNSINLGLAHGLCSKVALLSRMVKLNINLEISKPILEKSVKFLVSNANEFESDSIFPSKITESSYKSRLAWCYGDLCVGISIWQAADALNSDSLRSFAQSIFKKSISRIKYCDTMIVDATICHGTSGVALLYNRMYKNTNNDIFRDAALFWCEETIRLQKNPNVTSDYCAWFGEDKGWKSENGLLMGSTGICLTLLSVYKCNDYNWDKCLLIC